MVSRYQFTGLISTVLISSVLCLSLAVAQSTTLKDDITSLLNVHFLTLQQEDLAAHLMTLHPDSPFYEQLKQQIPPIFQRYDLIYRVDAFNLIGSDRDFAYARISQTTNKRSGPAFADNQLDQLWVFKRYQGDWRVWTSQMLSVTYVDAD
nr:hypothetical protein [uncultured bacterium]